jgi:glycosyltransferase involved in cell wall biosynthesis
VRRVLVISQDALSGQVAGTSIRALELGRVLSAHARVTLAGVGEVPAELAGMRCVAYHPQDPGTLEPALREADVVLSLTQWPPLLRLLRHSRARLIFDLYVPEALETIGGFPGSRRRVRQVLTQMATDRLVDALRTGDRFLCASEKQRDLWVGVMLAERLIDAGRYEHDPSLRSLIDVVPFGLPADPPAAEGDGVRERFPAIAADDEVVLWNGGLWPWLDAGTAIRALAELVETRPRARLVFMGAARQVPAQRAAESARTLAGRLGLLDSVVFFNDAWVPYERRGDWLLSADCAVSAHADQLETRFAFRTRLLDCFWAGLPVVCTAGDELAALVERERAGATVPPGDAQAMAAALAEVLEAGRGAYAPAVERVAARFRWEEVAAPLVRYVLEPDGPPRGRPRPRPPAPARRSAADHGARALLNRAGLRDWPRL